MNKYKYVVKDIQGNVHYKSAKRFDRADEALANGNEKKKELISNLPVGSFVDVLPSNIK